MGLLDLFKLEKLKIQVYSKRERDDILPTTFTVMFNPESYSQSFENVFSKTQGINTSGRSAKYSLTKPSDLSLKIIIDGTGVSNFGLANLLGGKKNVTQEVKKFLAYTVEMNGSTHEPKFLTIVWGNLNFKCRLQKVTINYTLFDNSGIPLRAELNATFISDIADTQRLKIENKSSPDLTHWRVVQAHDTLPLLCQEIYGSPSYFLKVAKVNKLNDFRKLIPGQEIFFPPIES